MSPKSTPYTPTENLSGKPTRDAPHMINERRVKRGYRKMGKINLDLSECGGAGDLAEYEKWLKEIGNKT